MKDIGFANIVHGLPEQGRGVDIVFSIENESRVQDKQMEKPAQATQCIAIHMNQCSFGCLSVRYHATPHSSLPVSKFAMPLQRLC